MPAVVRELGGASADGDVAALQDLLESVPDGFDPAGKAGLGLWVSGSWRSRTCCSGTRCRPRRTSGCWSSEGASRAGGLWRAMHEAVVERLRAASEGSRTRHSDVKRLPERLPERLPVERVPVERLRLGVVATNASVAEPFWRALGYEPTGEEQPYRYDHLVSTVALWERPL
jgi:hypothetical protein